MGEVQRFRKLKSAISDVPIIFTDGAYVFANNNVVPYEGYSYSDYIPVLPGQEIHLRSYFHDSPRAVFVTYDKGTVKQAIENTTPGKLFYDAVLTVPSDAYFFRFSCRTESKNSAFVKMTINPSLKELNSETSKLLMDMSSVKTQIVLPSKTLNEWKQGTILDSSNTKRIHIDCGYLELGRISITNAKPDGRIAVVTYSDAEHTMETSTTGMVARDFTVEITGGYVVLVGANSAYGDITPAYFDGYYSITYSQYINDVLKAIRESVKSFNEWKQGLPGQPQNANRVSIYCGKLKNGTLSVTTSAGFQYFVNKYSSPYYDSIISQSGWHQITTETDISDAYVVVIGCRTNYGAIDSSDIDGKITVTFTQTINRAVNDNVQRIYDGEKLLSQNGIDESLTVPSYYISDNYLDGKIARINTLAQACGGNGDTFTFITDVHWKMNAKKSPSLLNYLYHNTHINKLFGGGDYSDAKHSDDTYMKIASIMRDAWKGKAYYAIGNHEYLGYNGVMNTEENLAYYFESYYGSEVVYGSMLRNYFYIDNNGSKIRYIFLNRYAESTNSGQGASDGLEQEQLIWFQNIALNVDAGWSIIIVLHNIFGYNIISDNTIRPFITTAAAPLVSIIENYNGNGEIIAVISGHAHIDIVLHLSNGIPVIITTCDKNKTGGEPMADPNYWTSRADGTINEQAFDVMLVDIANRSIKAIRIGCPAQTWTQDGDNYVRSESVEERTVTF